MSHIQDGGLDVILRRKVLLPGYKVSVWHYAAASTVPGL